MHALPGTRGANRQFTPPRLQRGGDPNEGVAYEGATVLEPKVGH